MNLSIPASPACFETLRICKIHSISSAVRSFLSYLDEYQESLSHSYDLFSLTTEIIDQLPESAILVQHGNKIKNIHSRTLSGRKD